MTGVVNVFLISQTGRSILSLWSCCGADYRVHLWSVIRNTFRDTMYDNRLVETFQCLREETVRSVRTLASDGQKMKAINGYRKPCCETRPTDSVNCLHFYLMPHCGSGKAFFEINTSG